MVKWVILVYTISVNEVILKSFKYQKGNNTVKNSQAQIYELRDTQRNKPTILGYLCSGTIFSSLGDHLRSHTAFLMVIRGQYGQGSAVQCS